jgi:hypothetical protein
MHSLLSNINKPVANHAKLYTHISTMPVNEELNKICEIKPKKISKGYASCLECLK